MTQSDQNPAPQREPAPPAEPVAAPRRSLLDWVSDHTMTLVWSIAGAWVLLLAIGAGITVWTAAPSTCVSCHEMAPSVASWRISSHADVGCPSCHEPVRPWYAFPQTVAFRAGMLKRDMDAHRQRPDASALPSGTADLRPVPQENCLVCHDLSRAVTLPTGLVMDHAKHVKRNRSCVSCHRWVAHPPADAEKALLLMGQCYTCHGRQPGAKAPGRCDLCHTKAFKMLPASHASKMNWLAGHGKTAKVDRKPCQMCHDESFCTNCHGLPMPHPADWAKGTTPAHAAVATTNSKVCVQCHGPLPNLCSMCHHKGLRAENTAWASNHAPTVSQRGASFCLGCHDDLFCMKCHAQGDPTNLPSPPTP